MATAQKIQIKGGAEIARFLRQFGPRLEANIMRGAMVAGAKVIRDKARQNARGVDIAPEARRRLVRAIRHKRSRSRPGHVVAGIYVASIQRKDYEPGATANKDDPRIWWRWFEFGTADRWTGTRGGKGGFRRRINTNKRLFRGRIVAQPFLRPAFDAAHLDAIEEVTAYARKRVEAEAAKLADGMRAGT